MADVIDCAYSIEGTGEPLVLIHGIGAARDAWRFLTPHLRDHFTVVTYDLRGHGESLVQPPASDWMSWLMIWRRYAARSALSACILPVIRWAG